MTIPFVQARWYHQGRLRTPRLIVIHCTVSPEMGTGAESTARYFATTTRPGSTHRVSDSNSVVACVRDLDTAFGAAGANADGLHMELVGYPDQTPEQWTDAYSIATITNAGPSIREWSTDWGIPLRWLTVAQVADRVTPGLCTHNDVSLAFPDVSTGHWDPGPNFPKQRALDIWRPTSIPPFDLGDDDMAVLRRIENPNQSVLIVPDSTTKIGVRGFYSEKVPNVKGEEGIDGEDETRVDKGAWRAIVDDWLVKNGALTKT